jgi:hypothetical protein
MATLVSKDTRGVLVPREGEVEVLSQRTRAFKTFHLSNNADGTITYRVGGQVGPIHYPDDPLSDSPTFHEIDLHLLPVTDGTCDYACLTNGYTTRIWQAFHNFTYVAQFNRAGGSFYLAPYALCWENAAGTQQLIAKPTAGIAPTIDNDAYTCTWANAFGAGLHFRYNLSPDLFFKTVIIDSADDLPACTLVSKTGLKLTVVMAIAWAGARPAALNADVDLGSNPAGTAKQTLTPSAAFPHLLADGVTPAFWHQAPRAWDSKVNATTGQLTPQSVAMTWRIKKYAACAGAFLSVTKAALDLAVYPVFIDTAISEIQVSASSDDASNVATTWPGNGNFLANGVALTFGGNDDGYEYSYFYIAGMRFLSVPIPPGATINSASRRWH